MVCFILIHVFMYQLFTVEVQYHPLRCLYLSDLTPSIHGMHCSNWEEHSIPGVVVVAVFHHWKQLPGTVKNNLKPVPLVPCFETESFERRKVDFSMFLWALLHY